MSRKKICIITGSRAEWGLFYPVAREIKARKDRFKLQIIATGAHLSGDYGLTYKEIEKDGFKVDIKVKIPLPDDTEGSAIMSVSMAAAGIGEALETLRPDLVLLLGDRFETFAAAVASVFLKIPIAHIHGGEITQGSIDNTLRNAITKMAHFHFVAAETYKKRVIQMGEEPSRVFDVGALGLDNIKNSRLLSKKTFEKKAGIRLGRKNVLVTFNPATAEDKTSSEKQLKNLLEALDEMKDTRIIFTMPNPDMYSDAITGIVNAYVAKNPGKTVSFKSLGRVLYLSALQFMDIVIGNSSSGIIEAPSFRIPTVNIGSRQKGRIRAGSVLDADGSEASIKRAVKRAFSGDFQNACRPVK
ncbi:MAG: UDP-N-acetylglucosamine 2-epimerase, partial [Candidatus Omnitrophota bacterium]